MKESFIRALWRAIGRTSAPGAFTVHVYREDGGAFWARVDQMPGCFASSDDLPETLRALAEAIELYTLPPHPATTPRHP